MITPYLAKLELYAQAVAMLTTGTTTNKAFNEHMREYFPNILEFVSEILDAKPIDNNNTKQALVLN